MNSNYGDLVYENGSFDQDSMTKIDNLDRIFPGFKDRIVSISNNFYGFNLDTKTGNIDYETNLDILGCNINIHILKISDSKAEEIKDKRIVSLIENLRKHYTNTGKIEYAKLVEKYLGERKKLLKHNKGRYALVTKDKVEVIDRSIDTRDAELVFCIGEEFIIDQAILYHSRIHRKPKSRYITSLQIHTDGELIDDINPILITNAIIDTGCQVTTFDNSVIPRIQKSDPDYDKTLVEETATIASRTEAPCRRGVLTVEFCGAKYPDISVGFMDLPEGCTCLVGTDILNEGIFMSQFGKQIMFNPKNLIV